MIEIFWYGLILSRMLLHTKTLLIVRNQKLDYPPLGYWELVSMVIRCCLYSYASLKTSLPWHWLYRRFSNANKFSSGDVDNVTQFMKLEWQTPRSGRIDWRADGDADAIWKFIWPQYEKRRFVHNFKKTWSPPISDKIRVKSLVPIVQLRCHNKIQCQLHPLPRLSDPAATTARGRDTPHYSELRGSLKSVWHLTKMRSIQTTFERFIR